MKIAWICLPLFLLTIIALVVYFKTKNQFVKGVAFVIAAESFVFGCILLALMAGLAYGLVSIN